MDYCAASSPHVSPMLVYGAYLAFFAFILGYFYAFIWWNELSILGLLLSILCSVYHFCRQLRATHHTAFNANDVSEGQIEAISKWTFGNCFLAQLLSDGSWKRADNAAAAKPPHCRCSTVTIGINIDGARPQTSITTSRADIFARHFLQTRNLEMKIVLIGSLIAAVTVVLVVAGILISQQKEPASCGSCVDAVEQWSIKPRPPYVTGVPFTGDGGVDEQQGVLPDVPDMLRKSANKVTMVDGENASGERARAVRKRAAASPEVLSVSENLFWEHIAPVSRQIWNNFELLKFLRFLNFLTFLKLLKFYQFSNKTWNNFEFLIIIFDILIMKHFKIFEALNFWSFWIFGHFLPFWTFWSFEPFKRFQNLWTFTPFDHSMHNKFENFAHFNHP